MADDFGGRAGRRAGRAIGAARRVAAEAARNRAVPKPDPEPDPPVGVDRQFVENEIDLIDSDVDYTLTDDPELVPPLSLMRTEGTDVIETWFREAEEWSVVLRVFTGVGATSDVLEIGCGLGRVAFPLRLVLRDGTYSGFDSSRQKIAFVSGAYRARYPKFAFARVESAPGPVTFPYGDESFDVVFATSVWSHLLPAAASDYFDEVGRVLRPGGSAIVSVFLLDNYEAGRTRPGEYADPRFDVVHELEGHGPDFAVGRVDDPGMVTGYRLRLLEELANRSGLGLDRAPLVGVWSGAGDASVGARDLVILRRTT